MKKTVLKMCCSIVAVLVLSNVNVRAQKAEVVISSLKSAKGKVILNIFKDSDGYEQQVPFRVIILDKATVKDGVLVKDIIIEPGIYAITSVDDENGNGKMDKNLIGIPKEGFGFSNFFMEKMKKPTFDEIKVDLTMPAKVSIRTKYM